MPLQMIDFPYNDVCKSGYCVQCRDASTWAGAVAGCLEVPFTPAYCQLAQDSLTSLQSTGRDDSLGTRLTSALMKNIILVALIACLT